MNDDNRVCLNHFGETTSPEQEASIKRLRAAISLYYRWRKARPFLFVGQCAFLQAIVREIIAYYKEAAWWYGEEPDRKILKILYALLNEQPPPLPPTPQAPRRGAFLFYINGVSY